MISKLVLFICILVLASCASIKTNATLHTEQQKSIESNIVSNYNNPDSIEDDFYGVTVVDEYRYFENLEDSLVLDYLTEQDKLAEDYFKSISNWDSLENTIRDYNYKSKFSIIALKIISDSKWMYLKKHPKESLYKVYTYNPIVELETLVYSPKKKIYDIYPSPDGDLVVIAESVDGDFAMLKILDLISSNIFPEEIQNAFPRFGSIHWMGNRSFSFQYFPDIDVNSEGYLKNAETKLIAIEKNNKKLKSTTLFSKKTHESISPENRLYATPTLTGNYIVGVVVSNTYYTDAFLYDELSKDWTSLWSKTDKIESFELSDDNLFYTKYGVDEKLELFITPLNNPKLNSDTPILREENWVLGDFVVTSKGIFYTKIYNGVKAELGYISELNEGIIELPGNPGRITLRTKDSESSFLWLEVDSWVNSKETLIVDFEALTAVKFQTKDDGISTDNYIIEEIEIESYDGEMVPLSLIYRNDTNISNKTAPVLIFAYGAFGTSLRPYKYKFLLPWIEEGGIYAVAHVRGGEEKGKKWIDGGKKSSKPNTWKDFLASTEYLIENNYADPSRIVSWSSSAGAICVGRSFIESPELYAGVIILNGQLNSLRGEFEPGGQAAIHEYGSVETKEGFEALREMDVYQNLKTNANYPNIYLRSALNDTRVPAYHSAKFHSRFKDLSKNSFSLLDMEFEGGHGLLLTEDKRIEETLKILAFAFSVSKNEKYMSSQ